MQIGHRQLCVFAFTILVASCGNESSDELSESTRTASLSAATLGEQNILAVEAYLETGPYANADRGNGGRQAMVCRACHSLEPDGPNTIGPALHGVFGRNAGTHSGFNYSPSLRNADFVWTPRALDAWLAQPGSFLPGNRMAFAGVPRQQDRDDLIAYLLEATSNDSDNNN